MPAKSQQQQKFMGAQLAKRRAGQETDVEMATADLEDFATKPEKPLPVRAPKTGRSKK